MYGITFNLDAQALGGFGLTEPEAYEQVESRLTSLGYVRVQKDVYLCKSPKDGNELLVVHDTVNTLSALPWFSKAVKKIYAFELRHWGDIKRAFEE